MTLAATAMLPTLRIAGTGPVALACALFLVRRGVPPSRIILDAVGDAAAQAELPPTLARRALAISHGTRQLLERIAPMPAAGVIEEVDVSMPGRLGRTRIRASDLRVPALGYVIRYPALVRSLREAAARASWLPPNSPAPDAVIHAEGDAGENARIREFGQWALLTEVQVRAGSHVAYERFTDSGPLALLPLPDANRYSVVWCDRLAATEQRARLSLPELSRELNRAFGPMLGHLEVRDKPSLAPVARRSRRSLAAGPEVWIGNAAQALHPVAGQGLNLGLRDAFELADIVADAVRRGVAPQFAFERFARARRGDRSLTIALTDLMAASFTWPLARPLQSALLVTMDVVPPLRRPLARRLMFGWR